MKIVLREDVDHLGERGDIVKVAPGYARNYLLPKGMALEATPGNLKTIDLQRKIWAVRAAKEANEARELAERISAQALTVRKKAGATATLYGSVTTAEIASMLAEAGFEVDRRRIQLQEPIKQLGTFPIGVKVHKSVNAEFQLTVVGENGETAEDLAAAAAAAEAEIAELDRVSDDEDE